MVRLLCTILRAPNLFLKVLIIGQIPSAFYLIFMASLTLVVYKLQFAFPPPPSFLHRHIFQTIPTNMYIQAVGHHAQRHVAMLAVDIKIVHIYGKHYHFCCTSRLGHTQKIIIILNMNNMGGGYLSIDFYPFWGVKKFRRMPYLLKYVHFWKVSKMCRVIGRGHNQQQSNRFIIGVNYRRKSNSRHSRHKFYFRTV